MALKVPLLLDSSLGKFQWGLAEFINKNDILNVSKSVLFSLNTIGTILSLGEIEMAHASTVTTDVFGDTTVAKTKFI